MYNYMPFVWWCTTLPKNQRVKNKKKLKKWKNYLVGANGKGSKEHSMKLVNSIYW